MSSINIEIELLGNEVEVAVEYSISGNYIAATYYDPAEYPELEIEGVTRVVDGKVVDLSGIFTDQEFNLIEEIVEEYLCDVDPREEY